MAKEIPVTLKSVVAHVMDRRKGWLVTLHVDRGAPEVSFDFTSHVPDVFPEDSAVVIAKNYFQRTIAALAEQRADWQQSEAWLKGQATKKTRKLIKVHGVESYQAAVS